MDTSANELEFNLNFQVSNVYLIKCLSINISVNLHEGRNKLSLPRMLVIGYKHVILILIKTIIFVFMKYECNVLSWGNFIDDNI